MWSLTANKEWSEFEQKADREFEISVAYIAYYPPLFPNNIFFFSVDNSGGVFEFGGVIKHLLILKMRKFCWKSIFSAFLWDFSSARNTQMQ